MPTLYVIFVLFFHSHIYLSVIHFTYCYLSLYICFFSLEHTKKVLSLCLGEYLLITEVKFITSGTIRYNVIKTSY